MVNKNENIEKASGAMDFLLEMIISMEDCPIDFKVLKANKDFSNEVHKLFGKNEFYDLEDEYKMGLINFFNQGIELIKDLNKKIESQED